MKDALRPTDDQFHQVLQENFQPLVSQIPPFLGAGVSFDERASFACETKAKGCLVVNGRSTWRTSKGPCDLPSRVLPKQISLAVGSPLPVRLSEDSPFSDWPGVCGLSHYDKGNYLSVLYLAWAYIFSARWVELLNWSAGHECCIRYTAQGVERLLPKEKRSVTQIDIGDDACEDEVLWWRNTLSDDGWEATTTYNDQVYLSPWSVSTKDIGISPALSTNPFQDTKARSDPPLSTTALNYLSRFCVRHRLYAQCSAALAAVLYIPFLTGRTVSLPFPKPPPDRPECTDDFPPPIPDLLTSHHALLPKYMTLSSNTWGLRSLLHSTFFNPSIECNLVSAWLNPAFAVLDSISHDKTSLSKFLATRSPRLGILWLGAILTGLDASILRDTRTGLSALDLAASAWTQTSQTFLTSGIGDTKHSESINRADECRLLFISAFERNHSRPPVWAWTPFGETRLCDAEISVRKHTQCPYDTHCLEYESWEWMLDSGRTTPAALCDYKYDFLSQDLSECATRGIFGWLRSAGYPASERRIYQHEWIDLEDTDEEGEDEDEDVRTDGGREGGSILERDVGCWVDGIAQ
ncbi:hypothetical protein P170DRAFT_459437 [Aspergillus steynii IBT 23096]|uniref:Uncharacterized protein n=1 Tax=Aspergillus steynii IBT 23096 TaxID=1392250 RepID=A0A2I2FTG2_9EURO|nr:uncharacterized protein P170DRAFT_459437 [Aspergillus steynii IBT 23096]PLB43867.1 hypothetical protein P170DRAFT_459437 [Aspergillus steynii IBT 23096]